MYCTGETKRNEKVTLAQMCFIKLICDFSSWDKWIKQKASSQGNYRRKMHEHSQVGLTGGFPGFPILLTLCEYYISLLKLVSDQLGLKKKLTQ